MRKYPVIENDELERFVRMLGAITTDHGIDIVNFFDDEYFTVMFLEKLALCRYLISKPGGCNQLNDLMVKWKVNIRYVVNYLKSENNIKNRELVKNLIFDLEHLIIDLIDEEIPRRAQEEKTNE